MKYKRNGLLWHWLATMMVVALTGGLWGQIAVPAVPESSAAMTLADREATRRQQRLVLLRRLADEADGLLADRSWEPARRRFQQILDDSQSTGPTAELHARAGKGLASIFAKQATQQEARHHAVPAAQLWRQALAYDPTNRAYRESLARVKNKQLSLAAKYPANSVVDEQLQDKIEQIQQLILAGDAYLQTGQYEPAIARYRAVLILDPYHLQAWQGIRQAEQLAEETATLRLRQRKAAAMVAVEKEWRIQPRIAAVPHAAIGVTDQASTGSADLYGKLQRILIPECCFVDADLADVLAYLQQQSRLLDPDKVGVNLVFKGEPTAPSAGSAKIAMVRSLTLNLRQVPLLKILDFIRSLTSYKYKVEEHAVYVFPDTETSEVMLVRSFSVPPHFFPSTIEVDESATNALQSSAVSIASADVKRKLMDKGVEFPTGASAAYLPKTAKLVVRNTLDQLNFIDQLLARETDVSMQIEISAKFLEFSEDKLRDLSFNYRTRGGASQPPAYTRLPNRTVPAANATGGQALNFNNFYPQPATTAGDFGSATALRNAGNLAGNPLDYLLGRGVNRTPNMISLAGYVDGVGAEMLITALESELGADLMSEPKIVIFNGQKSKLRMVREFRYPTQWNAPEIPQQGNLDETITSVTVIPSNPMHFVKRDVGVTLEVKANATPDRRIDLEIMPEVTEFQGFINYGGDATTLDGEGNRITVVQGVALTPVFSTRSVETKMQVIDGQTVVMGGFIRSDNQEVEDKVPLLGDIPLIGGLFRSKASQTIKRNLVILLTARMIRPDGQYELATAEEQEISAAAALPVSQTEP